MKKYKISYPEGITQEKNLLNDEEHERVKDLEREASELKRELEEINKRKNPGQWESVRSRIKDLERELEIYGEWFSLGSPLGQALINGGHLILPTYKSNGSTRDHYPTKFEEVG